MYGNDPLKNCVGLVDIEYHYSEDNLKGVKFRERARAMNKLSYLLGYKHVKDKSNIDKHEFLNIWKHVIQYRRFTAARMNELFDVKKPMNNNNMNAKQILLYVNKLLKPYEICIKSYIGKQRITYYNYMNSVHGYDEKINKIYILQAHYERSQVEAEGTSSS